MTQPSEIMHASKQFQEWLMALKARAMLETHNQSYAYMRGVLHGLRQYMETDQVLAFADALPPLPRGLFIEGWRPDTAQSLASEQALADEVYRSLTAHHNPPKRIVRDVLVVLAEKLDTHRAKAIYAQLPKVLQPLWPQR
jgi:uncharacterized protein (DUF2267 family)